jgi:hypothetical protein
VEVPRAEAEGIARKGRLTSATLQKAHAWVFEEEQGTTPGRSKIKERRGSKREVNRRPEGNLGGLDRKRFGIFSGRLVMSSQGCQGGYQPERVSPVPRVRHAESAQCLAQGIEP